MIQSLIPDWLKDYTLIVRIKVAFTNQILVVNNVP